MMMWQVPVAAMLIVGLVGLLRAAGPEAADPYLWLEDVSGARAMEWVKGQNAVSKGELEKLPEFEPLRKRMRTILDSKDRIPGVSRYGEQYYNFWRDEKHVRGIWRRCTLEEYRKGEPAWETVLDLDALAASEKENWVWKGATVLRPTYDRCMVCLSRGGADATVMREFDFATKAFLADGFVVPEAKSRLSWLDKDAVYIGTDFGPGSLTDSGYPRVVKLWKRGTPLSAAKIVYEGEVRDVAVTANVVHDHGRVYEFIHRAKTFFTDETLCRRGDAWVRIEKPDDTELSTFGEYLLLRLRSDWTIGGKTYAAGTLLAADFEKYVAGERAMEALFVPTERTSIAGISATKNFLILNELDNVASRAWLLKPEKGRWDRRALEGPPLSSFNVSGVFRETSDEYFMTSENFLVPTTLSMGVAGNNGGREDLKKLPAFFDAKGLEVRQHETVSKDGTKVPYFVVARKELKLDGSTPTLLTGYGGFEISMTPGYRSQSGAAWLEKGNAYVLANIRGGGEFGPTWHNAARKENRQRAYEDFIAVAEDLIARKITSPKHLGIQGGSNGGLLVGVMLTQRPDLFGAVVCRQPLLDMRRYHKLLAGASWMDEYGDPDRAEEWAFLAKYSPYQNVKAATYPRTLFLTSTRDDRVHPGHARKMAALMQAQGHNVLFYENIEGGHAGAANNEQTAFMDALAYAFLLKELQ